MKHSNLFFFFLCMLFFNITFNITMHAYPDSSLKAHSRGQPFFAHVMPEETYEGTPLERNLAREEEIKEKCVHCGENHE